MFQQAVTAYENATRLKPNDAMWHFRFAELLYGGYWSYYSMETNNPHRDVLVHCLSELDTALGLDPTNEDFLGLAGFLTGSYPDMVQQTDNGYVFLALTSVPPTPVKTDIPPTATRQNLATPLATPTAGQVPTTAPVPTASPTSSGNPLCGAALLLPVLLSGFLWLKYRLRA
jgi:hypothetical protein